MRSTARCAIGASVSARVAPLPTGAETSVQANVSGPASFVPVLPLASNAAVSPVVAYCVVRSFTVGGDGEGGDPASGGNPPSVPPEGGAPVLVPLNVTEMTNDREHPLNVPSIESARSAPARTPVPLAIVSVTAEHPDTG